MHPVDNHQPAKVSENGVVLSTIKAPVIDTVRNKKNKMNKRFLQRVSIHFGRALIVGQLDVYLLCSMLRGTPILAGKDLVR